MRGGGPMSTGGIHLSSSKEPSWVLAVLCSPACDTDRHEPSPETCLMDVGNIIPTAYNLSTRVQGPKDPSWPSIFSHTETRGKGPGLLNVPSSISSAVLRTASKEPWAHGFTRW